MLSTSVPRHQALIVDRVEIRYGTVSAVKDVTLRLEPGQIGCLLGASGCGKSTLLRAIAGFEQIAHGTVSLGGRTLSNPGFMVPAEQRQIGMVFQDIALFPHLTVAQNIAFGLTHLKASDQAARVSELLVLVGLAGAEQRYPHSLSGGQQQRIALARALAPKPSVLLMDEPFAGLDTTLKETLVPDIRRILVQEGITALVVTHDQQEAYAIADKVALMHQGRIEQFASPFQIYHQPETRYVADFIGQGYFLPATLLSAHQLNTDLGVLSMPDAAAFPDLAEVDLLIRPDDVLHDDESDFLAEITGKHFKGTFFQYEVTLANGRSLLCIASSHQDHRVGQQIGIRLDLDHFVLFARASVTEPQEAVSAEAILE
jgi:iron(III) transport system ATP-binding protein